MSFPITTDLYVTFKNVRRLDTNAPITAITSAIVRLLDTSAVEVSGTSVSATQIGSTGGYEATIPDTGTANLTAGTPYDLEITFVESGSSWKRTVRKRDTASYD